MDELASNWYDEYHDSGDSTAFKNDVRTTLLCEPKFEDAEFKDLSKDAAIQAVADAADEFYERKEEMLGEEFMIALERFAWLQSIDEQWRDHLRSMDDLKEGIYLRAYGQKDPLLEYKQEAYNVFVDLIADIDKAVVNTAFKYFPQIQERQGGQRRVAAQRPAERHAESSEEAVAAAVPKARSTVTSSANLQFSHATPSSAYQTSGGGEDGGGAAATVRKSGPDIKRNDPCPCGSGKKYKHCHGAPGAEPLS